MRLKAEVLERLLLCKSFLERIRFQPVAVHDRHTLASNLIAAHDASELALAAICDQLGCLPGGHSYLMDYFDPLKKSQHPTHDVYAKEYFRNLNSARALLKHQGLYPDARQWARVGETSFQHITKWCWDYLKESFSELDAAALLINPDVKNLFDAAKHTAAQGNHKGALELLALALSKVFEDNNALRGFEAGNSKVEDVIRLVGFGIHGNDFLALQEFLPHVRRWSNTSHIPEWKQSQYGHPGNWTNQTVEFCLRTFVDVAVKLQGAPWIPGPISRDFIYDQQIEAIKDNVEVWRYVTKDRDGNVLSGFSSWLGEKHREVLMILKKGEKRIATVSLATNESQDPFAGLGGSTKSQDTLNVILNLEKNITFGQVLLADVKVTCVPKAADFVKKFFPLLPEIDWEFE